MKRAALTRLSVLCLGLWALMCCAVLPARGGDLAAEAASGQLWKQTAEQLSKGVLQQVKFRAVDNATLRLRRDSHLGFGGLITGDVVIRFSMERLYPVELNTTVYNKGDNGELTKAEFDLLLKDSIEKLTALLQVEPLQRKSSKKETGLRLRTWEWETPRCTARLEASATGSGKKYTSEFIRLTLARDRDELERGGAEDAVRRADLRQHVKTLEDGSTVYIEGVPMVDQGEKGYCVPASLSRVFAYYGMDGVDQHALAALCRSGGNGTTLEGMEKALRSISGAFHVSVVPMKWLGEKELKKEFMRLMQKEKIAPEQITPGVMLKHLQSKPAIMEKGFREIKKQIDAGIPVVWAVMLGIFPEQGLPQAAGGHMRLIIGYNEERRAIIYSDSWGYNHDMKAMSMAQACIITQALYVLRPKR